MLRATIQYVRSPEVTARAFGNAVREANSAAVEAWHDEFLPYHFTVAGGRKYGYQDRSGADEPSLVESTKHPGRIIKNPKYFWRKYREMKIKTPLVYSGRAREASKTIKITSSVNKGVGTFPTLPRYMYQYKPGQPDKADEMTRVTNDEVQRLAEVHEKTTTEIIERLTTSTSVVAA